MSCLPVPVKEASGSGLVVGLLQGGVNLLYVVGGTEVSDDEAGLLCYSGQAWGWQDYTGFSACHLLEVSAY